jgi:SAM-dependent methyltransferase
VKYEQFGGWIPAPLERHIKHFEAAICDAVREFADSLPERSLVLDAGAGEGSYAHLFKRQRYVALDLGIGDETWDYSKLDVLGDLSALPFPDRSFDAALNIVTLEHVKEPARVICELSRVLKAGGKLVLVAPHEWEEHQEPHDYYRYTRYGLKHLLSQAGFKNVLINPVGGIFRLLQRRLLSATFVLPTPLNVLFLAIVFVPAMIVPALDVFDKRRNFTLGYICTAHKSC